jgi:excisionase family DNA binding protein
MEGVTMTDRKPKLQALQRVREFAEDNSLSEAKVWDMIAKGQLKAVKIGSATRIRTEDAQDWRNSLPQRIS